MSSMTTIPAGDQKLTLYTNQVGYVLAKAALAGRDGVYQITNVPPSLILESLHVVSDGIGFVNARAIGQTTLAEVVRNTVGKLVSRTISNFVGTLVGVSSEHAFVQVGNEYQFWPLDDCVIPSEGTIPNSRLQVQASGVSEKNNEVLFGYLAEWIILMPNYNVELEKGRARLTYGFKVDNRVGKPFKDVELELIPGEVNLPYFEHGAPRYVRRVSRDIEEVCDSLCMLEEGGAFEEAGQIGFNLGRQTIPEGESRFDLFVTRRLPCSIGYEAMLSPGKPDISTLLKFKAPLTLPRGAVGVYSRIEQQDKFEGGSSLPATLKGQEVRIDLRTPDTLKIEVEQLGKPGILKSSVKGVYSIATTYRVTARNAGNEDAAIVSYLPLGLGERVLESTSKGKLERGRMRWNIAIPKGSCTIFDYTLEKLQFRALSQEELHAALGRCPERLDRMLRSFPVPDSDQDE